MIEAFRALGALTFAAGASYGAWRTRAPSWTVARPILRGAPFFGWATLSFAVADSFAHSRAIGTPPVDRAVVATMWFFATGLLGDAASGSRSTRTASSVAGLASLVGIEVVAFRQDMHASTLFATAAFWLAARWLTSAMQRPRFAALRSLVHAATLVSTVALLLPGAMIGYLEHAISIPPLTLARACLSAAFWTLALRIGVPASLEFVRAGGTPDPLDPPHALVTRGIYARMRHPLQIAEIFSVCACVCIVPTRWTCTYALLFAATLVGPMRLLEEISLRERFGAAAIDYVGRTPAFVPRSRSNAP